MSGLAYSRPRSLTDGWAAESFGICQFCEVYQGVGIIPLRFGYGFEYCEECCDRAHRYVSRYAYPVPPKFLDAWVNTNITVVRTSGATERDWLLAIPYTGGLQAYLPRDKFDGNPCILVCKLTRDNELLEKLLLYEEVRKLNPELPELPSKFDDLERF